MENEIAVRILLGVGGFVLGGFLGVLFASLMSMSRCGACREEKAMGKEISASVGEVFNP